MSVFYKNNTEENEKTKIRDQKKQAQEKLEKEKKEKQPSCSRCGMLGHSRVACLFPRKPSEGPVR